MWRMRTPRWRGAEKLRVLLVPVASLKNDERNARHHDERSFEAVRTSLAKFGQRKPIVVDGDVVVAGNGTLVAARREGWTHIATVDADGLSPEEVRAYALADNRTAELSSWDYGALHAEWRPWSCRCRCSMSAGRPPR
jgi:ParB-like chromosome segregation protein Spo0J